MLDHVSAISDAKMLSMLLELLQIIEFLRRKGNRYFSETSFNSSTA